MSDKYFIDTNIIVYAHDGDHPEKQSRAQELIFSGMRNSDTSISAQVLSEFFVTITRKITRKFSIPAARHVVALLSHLEVVEIDADLIQKATFMQEQFLTSYWDGLILAAADRAECTVLYSEDFSHGQRYGGITSVNPFLQG
jgi:predicted nucleic acid-binding protein